jgi:hypothetical protein
MSVKERLLALKLLERQNNNPEYARIIGIEVNVVQKEEEKTDLCANT